MRSTAIPSARALFALGLAGWLSSGCGGDRSSPPAGRAEPAPDRSTRACPRGEEDLLDAARRCRSPLAQDCLAQGVALDALDAGGRSALDRAAESGCLAIVEALLDAGIQVFQSDARNPLGAAAMSGNREITARLLARRFDPAAPFLGATPLHHAIRNGFDVLALDLIDAGAPVDAVDRDGRTPLGLAVSTGRSAVVVALLAQGASPLQPSAGRTPVEIAVERQDAEMIQLLAESIGYDPRAPEDSGPFEEDVAPDDELPPEQRYPPPPDLRLHVSPPPPEAAA